MKRKIAVALAAPSSWRGRRDRHPGRRVHQRRTRSAGEGVHERRAEGRELWTSPSSARTASPALSATRTPRTRTRDLPKFQQQLGRVIALREMINWCIQQPLEGSLSRSQQGHGGARGLRRLRARGVALAPAALTEEGQVLKRDSSSGPDPVASSAA